MKAVWAKFLFFNFFLKVHSYEEKHSYKKKTRKKTPQIICIIGFANYENKEKLQPYGIVHYLDSLLGRKAAATKTAVAMVLRPQQELQQAIELNYLQNHQLNQPLHLIMDFLQQLATCHFVYF